MCEMMNSNTRTLMLTFAIGLSVSLTVLHVPASAGVIVDSWGLVTRAGDFVDGPGDGVIVDDTVVLPFELTRIIEKGDSRSTSTYNFDSSTHALRFLFGYDHVRDGDGATESHPTGDYAISWGRIEFTVTEPLAYQIGGAYALHGENSILMRVFLTTSTQEILFYNIQSSTTSPNQIFEVGGQNGTEQNVLKGDLSGILLPGVSYTFEYDNRITTSFDDSGASASGWLDFTITPEPAAGILTVLGALVLLRRRSTEPSF
jgi:hypothetical protein